MASTYSEKLKCSFCSWNVIGDELLSLHLLKNHCCDMRGAIEMAKHICPDVREILVFAGDRKDVKYVSANSGWRCLMYPSEKVC